MCQESCDETRTRRSQPKSCVDETDRLRSYEKKGRFQRIRREKIKLLGLPRYIVDEYPLTFPEFGEIGECTKYERETFCGSRGHFDSFHFGRGRSRTKLTPSKFLPFDLKLQTSFQHLPNRHCITSLILRPLYSCGLPISFRVVVRCPDSESCFFFQFFKGRHPYRFFEDLFS